MMRPLWSARQPAMRERVRAERPERITPADYHFDPQRRAIADRVIAAIGAAPDDVSAVDVTESGVFAIVLPASRPLPWFYVTHGDGTVCRHRVSPPTVAPWIERRVRVPLPMGGKR